MKDALLKVLCYAAAGILLILNSCNPGGASGAASLPSDSMTIAKGRDSFNNKCAGCHSFDHNSIGPQLSGVTLSSSVDWIRNFIKNPKKVIESGDTTAKKLFEKYKTLMPSFGYLDDAQIDAMIAYMHTQTNRAGRPVEEETNDIKNPIAESIRSSDLEVGLQLITQIPASSAEPPFTRIVKLDYEPGSGDLFILDLRGKLFKLVNGQPQVYMDMAMLKPTFIHQPGLATGFGSFAFHPQFEKNGLLYTTHTDSSGSAIADFDYPDSIPVVLQWVLTEWKTKSDVFPFSGKGRELLRINMPTQMHGVQEIAFNRLAKRGDKDFGLLYAGIGDGGSVIIGKSLVSKAPQSIWGSIIRIDPLGKNSLNGKYGIPRDNPFYSSGNKKFSPEVFAYGFRNPHRLNWSKSGQLFSVNIGEHNIEALNIIKPGHFYGWPIREGTFVERFSNETGKIYPLPPDDSSFNITYPVAQFDHDEGTAISGGFEYDGSVVPELKGKYIFGDIGTGRLFFVHTRDLRLGSQSTIEEWHVSVNGVPSTLAKLCGSDRVDMRFGMDARGELYCLTKRDGKVYKLVRPARRI